MSENVIQTSFSAGELAPSIFARTDLATYHQGLANCRNFFVDYRSGVSTRQGSSYVLQCRSLGSKLVPFSVTTSVTYMIEFGDHYCRFYSNGAPVLEAPFGVTSITNASPAIANVPGHNFSVGDWIFLANTIGMPAMNDRFALIAGITGNLLTLTDVNSVPIDSTTFGSYSSGGTASRVYTKPPLTQRRISSRPRLAQGSSSHRASRSFTLPTLPTHQRPLASLLRPTGSSPPWSSARPQLLLRLPRSLSLSSPLQGRR